MPSINYTQLFAVPLTHYLAGTPLPTGQWKMMLLSNAYTPNKDHKFASDVNANEISGSGYPAGGVNAAPVVTVDDPNDRIDINFPTINVPGATFTAYYGFLYLDTAGAATTDPAGALIDFGGPITATAGTFQIPPLSTPIRLNV